MAGVGLAAIRDAASAFRTRRDLPVHGDRTYVFGFSQSGRFLRTFLHQGFNVDESGRRAFDLVWPHIAGAAQGSFNERFANPGYSSFPATRFPFTDREQRDPRLVIIYDQHHVAICNNGCDLLSIDSYKS